MPYFTITDFAAGLDLRRSTLTAPAGTLRKLLNAHVNAGGEIEKRFAFASFATVGANTRGLASVNQKLYTFAPMTQEQINVLHPTSRLNSHAYAVSDTITVASNRLRIFICVTAGTTAATEPAAAYAAAADNTTVTDGSAVFLATTPAGWRSDISVPVRAARISNHVYSADTIRVADNPTRVFLCKIPGTSAEFEPAAYATAVDGTLILDGDAVFLAQTPPYPARANSHDYHADAIVVASNPTRVFTCETPGVSAAAEPREYTDAQNGMLVVDGTAVFRASVSTTYVPRADSHVYNAGEVVTTISSKGHIFTCTTAGTSNFTEPTAYLSAVDGQTIIDGAAVFTVSTPSSPYSPRGNARTYVVGDIIATVSAKNLIFTCSTAGVSAPGEPAGYATAVAAASITDGSAVFVASAPSYPARLNSHAYSTDVITVASNNTRLFTCATAAGKSAGAEPLLYASAGDGAPVNDGTAIFIAREPLYENREGTHAYSADQIVVASNPTRIFTCETTRGRSAAVEPTDYALALDDGLVTDGTVAFRATTPSSDWIVAAQPPIPPPKIEPSGPWGIGILPLETTTLGEIVDYDLFDNKVFVVAWTDAAHTQVVRCYDGREVPKANGFFVKTYKTKLYSVGGSVLYFSAIGNPGDWEGTGAGSIDLSLEDSDMTDCLAIEAYYDKLAIFSKTACQLWLIDPDPLKSQYVQTLREAGTIAWRSVLQYGSGDIMYLAPSGVRSLRARNSSLAAAVSDIGSPIDPPLQDLFRMRGEEFLAGTMAVLQPVTGRFWIIMPDRIYVLSAYPGPKVTAWSQYDPTYSGPDGTVTFTVTAATNYRHHVVVRDENNNVYAYGGNNPAGPVYDDTEAELVFPFHAGDQPATNKFFQSLDAVATGQWDVAVSVNPSNEAEDRAGIIDGPTFLKGDFMHFAEGTHMSVRLRSLLPEATVLSNLIVHYNLGSPREIPI